jgi:copper(I)-binding protein
MRTALIRVLPRILVSFVFLIAATTASAEQVRGGDLVVEMPWARASIGTSRPAAAYLTIKNEGLSADTLLGVKTDAAATPEVHKMEMRDGIANMGPSGPVEVPAQGIVTLAPGGMHVMLRNLNHPLKKGEYFSMTLIFEKEGQINIVVPIYSIGASGPDE